MVYKTIVVHCDTSKSITARLAIAVDLAERYQAHLVGIHVRPQFVPPIFAEGGYGMSAFFNQHEASVKSSETAASAAFAKAVKGTEITSEWHSLDGRADEILTGIGRDADLTIVGQTGPEDADLPTPPDLPERMAFATSRGVLVIPYQGCENVLGGRVMLCWNASRESARAASEALPLLKAARAVTVLLVEPITSSKNLGTATGAGVKTWLKRHGVEAIVQVEVAANDDVGSVVLSRAADLGVDLIVMGIYGHSRLREMVLGGVSRTLLASMTVPVFMAH